MVKIGDEIVIVLSDWAEGKVRVKQKFTVTQIYPAHVLTVNKYGIRRCFTVGDLVRMGYENVYVKKNGGLIRR